MNFADSKMITIGIDPGTTHSAMVALFDGQITTKLFLPNDEMAEWIRESLIFDDGTRYVCEMISSQGMAVGREVFETCVFIGRLMEIVPSMERVTRGEVKLHLCGTSRAKDPNVRQALLDIYGPPGTKKNPGPTYGVSKHLWSALAVAHCAATGCKLYDPSPKTKL